MILVEFRHDKCTKMLYKMKVIKTYIALVYDAFACNDAAEATKVILSLWMIVTMPVTKIL